MRLNYLVYSFIFLFSVVTVNANQFLLDAVESWPPNISDANLLENSDESKNNRQFQFNYLMGSDVDQALDFDLSVPISSSFSLLIGGSYIKEKEVVKVTRVRTWRWSYWRGYYRGYGYSYSYSNPTYLDCSALVSWEPLKGTLFSPYIAAGPRYSSLEIDDDYDSSEFGYAVLAGLKINLGILTLRGEYSFGSYGESDATEIIGDVGLRVFGSTQLHANYKIVDCDDAYDSISMYGAGISFGF